MTATERAALPHPIAFEDLRVGDRVRAEHPFWETREGTVTKKLNPTNVRLDDTDGPAHYSRSFTLLSRPEPEPAHKVTVEDGRVYVDGVDYGGGGTPLSHWEHQTARYTAVRDYFRAQQEKEAALTRRRDELAREFTAGSYASNTQMGQRLIDRIIEAEDENTALKQRITKLGGMA